MFYETFRLLSLAIGKTPTAVGNELGLSRGNISYWKKTGAAPGGTVLQKIADYFGVTTDYLLTGDAPVVAYETKDPDVEVFECIEMLKHEPYRRMLLKLRGRSEDDIRKVLNMIDIILGDSGEAP